MIEWKHVAIFTYNQLNLNIFINFDQYMTSPDWSLTGPNYRGLWCDYW